MPKQEEHNACLKQALQQLFCSCDSSCFYYLSHSFWLRDKNNMTTFYFSNLGASPFCHKAFSVGWNCLVLGSDYKPTRFCFPGRNFDYTSKDRSRYRNL